MKEFVEKLIGRLEELKTFKLNLADAMSELMKKDRIDNYISREEAVEIVNHLAKEYNNGWIACSERLPEKDMWCFATFESGNVDKIQYLVTNNWGWNGEMGDNRVIAWMPLPAPYQKGSE